MKHVFASALLAGALSLPSAGQAQQQCGNAEQVDQVLREKYGEAPRFAGVLNGRHIMFIYATKDGSTFSVLIVDPASDTACLAAAGQGFEPVLEEATGDPT